MTFETELKSHYAQVHERLLRPPTDNPRRTPRPPKPAIRIIEIKDKSALSPLSTAVPPKRPFVSQIVKWVSAVEQVEISDLFSHRRPRRLSVTRFIIYHLARKYTRASMPLIAQHVGGRDHTSILHGIARLQELRKTDVMLDMRVKEYEAVLDNPQQHCDVEGNPRLLCGRCPFRIP